MKQHTKEPWSHAYRENAKGMYAEEVFDTDGNVIATMAWHQVKSRNVTTTDREANARRIVACINACAGLSNYYLENNGFKRAIKIIIASRLEAEQQRDELLAALTKVRDRFFPSDQLEQDRDLMWDVINDAIARAEAAL